MGLADDPGGTLINLTSEGGSGPLPWEWELPDGRLLVESVPQGRDIVSATDFQTLDPRTGAVKTFANSGLAVMVTSTRFLGLLNISYGRGDLTTVDLITGKSTVLAPEYAMVAIPEPTTPDPYPVDARVAYQFRARFSSPWDGIWLATAP